MKLLKKKITKEQRNECNSENDTSNNNISILWLMIRAIYKIFAKGAVISFYSFNNYSY